MFVPLVNQVICPSAGFCLSLLFVKSSVRLLGSVLSLFLNTLSFLLLDPVCPSCLSGYLSVCWVLFVPLVCQVICPTAGSCLSLLFIRSSVLLLDPVCPSCLSGYLSVCWVLFVPVVCQVICPTAGSCLSLLFIRSSVLLLASLL